MKHFCPIFVVFILLVLGCSPPFKTGQSESESADSQNDKPPEEKRTLGKDPDVMPPVA